MTTSTLLDVADVTECGAPAKTYFDIDSQEVEFSLTVANSFALGWELAWLFESDPDVAAPDSDTSVVACGGTEIFTGDLVVTDAPLLYIAITDDDSDDVI